MSRFSLLGIACASAILFGSAAGQEGIPDVEASAGRIGWPWPLPSKIKWGSCPDFVTDRSFQCGFLEVPMDYNDKRAGKGRLAVIKAKAKGRRRGTLYMNPGGPGGSGLEGMGLIAPLLYDLTGGEYDLVSWDPRGVGSLTIPSQVDCFNGADDFNTFFNNTIELTGIEMTGTFRDQRDLDALYAQADIMQQKYLEVGKRCQKQPNGEHLRYMGTAAAARDLAALADAIDGPGSLVNYFGVSYGTMLGAWFVNMFPNRVGKILLDAVIDATVFDKIEFSLGWSTQLTDADRAYEGLVTACALAGPEHCAIAKEGDTVADVHATIQNLIQVAHDKTLADSSYPIKSGTIRTTMRSIVYWPDQWRMATNDILAPLIATVNAQQEVKADTLARLRTFAAEQPHLGPFVKRQDAPEPLPYPPWSTHSIMCGDNRDPAPSTTMKDVFDNVVRAAREITHMFGAQWPLAPYYCSFWPDRAVERYTGPWNKKLANPILVTGNTYDPVTPFWQAKSLARNFGDQAALVRMNGFGHSLLTAPSKCISKVSRAYFLQGVLPVADETVCEVDETFEIYPGVTTKMVLDNMPKCGLKWD